MNDTLDRTGEHQVLVTSARDGQAPLTWAQRLQWDDTEWLKPHDHYYNQYRVLAVPEGCGPPELLECLRVVMSRHESLRTRFPLDADGTPGSGSPPRTNWPCPSTGPSTPTGTRRPR